jgi:hypothetical protein
VRRRGIADRLTSSRKKRYEPIGPCRARRRDLGSQAVSHQLSPPWHGQRPAVLVLSRKSAVLRGPCFVAACLFEVFTVGRAAGRQGLRGWAADARFGRIAHQGRSTEGPAMGAKIGRQPERKGFLPSCVTSTCSVRPVGWDAQWLSGCGTPGRSAVGGRRLCGPFVSPQRWR